MNDGAAGSLLAWYGSLRAAFGPRHWWPARSRYAIILGAILTQNTAWSNVERAFEALRRAGIRNWDGLRSTPPERLAEVIRSSGAYRQKAQKLHAFLQRLDLDFGGSTSRLARLETAEMRTWLLGIWGIGPETADSILLYAFGRPVFVVDAYTLRLLIRHRCLPEGARYEEAQRYLQDRLPADISLYNDFHAQIVRLGQLHCRPRPRCAGCPLEPFLPPGGAAGHGSPPTPTAGGGRGRSVAKRGVS